MVKKRTGQAAPRCCTAAGADSSSSFLVRGLAAASAATTTASATVASSNVYFETERPARSCARTQSNMSAAQGSAGTRNAYAYKMRTHRLPVRSVGTAVAPCVLNRGKGVRESGSDGQRAANAMPRIQETKIREGKSRKAKT